MHAPQNQLDAADASARRRTRKALPKGKWIEGTSADESYCAAARAALRVRLDLVWFYLKLAARQAHEDSEYVHQLRVSTRRAMATVDLFDDVLPRRRAKWMNKQLRRVRKAAGVARDSDVMIERFSDVNGAASGANLEPLLHLLRQQRDEAQSPIQDVYNRLKRHDFPQRTEKLLKRVRPRGEHAEETDQRFGDVARRKLQPVVAAFFEAASADLTDVEQLHQMRIEGKLLRYSMEILAGAFPASFRGELYPQIEELQSHLGEINDHATANRWLQNSMKQSECETLRDTLSELATCEEKALLTGRERFLNHWTQKRARDLQAAFEQLLSPQAEKQAG